MKCIIKNCETTFHKKLKGVSLHKFPKNQILRQKWLQLLGIPDFVPSDDDHVCSEHFKNNSLKCDSKTIISITNSNRTTPVSSTSTSTNSTIINNAKSVITTSNAALKDPLHVEDHQYVKISTSDFIGSNRLQTKPQVRIVQLKKRNQTKNVRQFTAKPKSRITTIPNPEVIHVETIQQSDPLASGYTDMEHINEDVVLMQSPPHGSAVDSEYENIIDEGDGQNIKFSKKFHPQISNQQVAGYITDPKLPLTAITTKNLVLDATLSSQTEFFQNSGAQNIVSTCDGSIKQNAQPEHQMFYQLKPGGELVPVTGLKVNNNFISTVPPTTSKSLTTSTTSAIQSTAGNQNFSNNQTLAYKIVSNLNTPNAKIIGTYNLPNSVKMKKISLHDAMSSPLPDVFSSCCFSEKHLLREMIETLRDAVSSRDSELKTLQQKCKRQMEQIDKQAKELFKLKQQLRESVAQDDVMILG